MSFYLCIFLVGLVLGRLAAGWAAWMLAGQFGLDRHNLENSVFPGLAMEADPGMLG